MLKKATCLLVLIGIMCLMLLGCSKTVNAKLIDEKLILANKYLMDQKYEEAILAFQEIIKITPKLVIPYVGISNTYRLQGNIKGAEDVLLGANDKVQDKNELQLCLANFYFIIDEVNKGDELLKNVKVEKIENKSLLNEIAWNLINLTKNKDKAIELLKRAIEISPNDKAICLELYQLTKDKAYLEKYIELTAGDKRRPPYELSNNLFIPQGFVSNEVNDDFVKFSLSFDYYEKTKDIQAEKDKPFWSKDKNNIFGGGSSYGHTPIAYMENGQVIGVCLETHFLWTNDQNGQNKYKEFIRGMDTDDYYYLKNEHPPFAYQLENIFSKTKEGWKYIETKEVPLDFLVLSVYDDRY